jgi:hypothetical protein
MAAPQREQKRTSSGGTAATRASRGRADQPVIIYDLFKAY